LLVALVLCAISIISAGRLQTDFGRVTMTDITLETEAGNLTAYLFKPKSATAENPAPAVLCYLLLILSIRLTAVFGALISDHSH